MYMQLIKIRHLKTYGKFKNNYNDPLPIENTSSAPLQANYVQLLDFLRETEGITYP